MIWIVYSGESWMACQVPTDFHWKLSWKRGMLTRLRDSLFTGNTTPASSYSCYWLNTRLTSGNKQYELEGWYMKLNMHSLQENYFSVFYIWFRSSPGNIHWNHSCSTMTIYSIYLVYTTYVLSSSTLDQICILFRNGALTRFPCDLRCQCGHHSVRYRRTQIWNNVSELFWTQLLSLVCNLFICFFLYQFLWSSGQYVLEELCKYPSLNSNWYIIITSKYFCTLYI